MAIDKKTFMQCVTVLFDTREQKNQHILSSFANMGVMAETRKLDFGDYSFTAENRDFSLSCVIERKANVDEIYNNIMQDRERLEKELYAASCCGNQLTLLLEDVASWDELKLYEVSQWQMDKFPQRKIKQTGAYVYSTLKAWSPSNRYDFKVDFVKNNVDTAAKMLEIFYYYWRSYKEMTGARK